MSPVFLLILLLLSRSSHACNARSLRVDAKYSSKGFGVAKLTESSVPAVMPPPGGMAAVDTIQGGASATNYGKPRSSEKQTKDAEGKRSRVLSAGIETVMPSLSGSQHATKTKVRSLVGNESNEEYLVSKETGVFADLVAMDYPKARRGPSIHNR